MKKQRGEVVLATVIVMLTAVFVGLVAAGSGPSKSAEAPHASQVAEAK